jgi:hypothetical protein
MADAFWHFLGQLRRHLSGADGGSAFSIDFSQRPLVQAVFEEGSGSLLTDGTRACMEHSHLKYGVPIEGGDPGEIGLRLVMDGEGLTCGHGAEIAVGHLASWKAYSFGDFEWRARIHHAPSGSNPPSNSFTCLSTFVHGSLTHNELAWCFPASPGNEVHMAYWYNDQMHRTVRRLNFDLTQAVHTFTTRWRDVGIDWLVDQTVVHQVRGKAGVDIPWEPMSIRVILRPKNLPSVFLGDSYVEVSHVSYEPAYASAIEHLATQTTAFDANPSSLLLQSPPPPSPHSSPPPPSPMWPHVSIGYLPPPALSTFSAPWPSPPARPVSAQPSPPPPPSPTLLSPPSAPFPPPRIPPASSDATSTTSAIALSEPAPLLPMATNSPFMALQPFLAVAASTFIGDGEEAYLELLIAIGTIFICLGLSLAAVCCCCFQTSDRRQRTQRRFLRPQQEQRLELHEPPRTGRGRALQLAKTAASHIPGPMRFARDHHCRAWGDRHSGRAGRSRGAHFSQLGTYDEVQADDYFR